MTEVDVKIDIPEDLCFPSRQRCCIYRVPPMLRGINQEAYTPQLVSIGPFHSDLKNEKFSNMEKWKVKYLEQFCRRAETTQAELFQMLEPMKYEIYRCYEVYSSEPCDDFLEMILLDSVFIIEVLLQSEHDRYILGGDYMLNRPLVRKSIDRDLILLENQVPYFVLENLYENFIRPKDVYPSFFYITCMRFESFLKYLDVERNSSESVFKTSVAKYEEEQVKNKYCPKHFTDLIRKFLSDKRPDKSDNEDSVADCEEKQLKDKCTKHFTDLIGKDKSVSFKCTATKLHDSGVEFKVHKKAKPLTISLDGGVLRMSRINFEDHTECLIRNLIAFEQCHQPKQFPISDYMLKLDLLINSEKDVDLLTSRGVIVNLLGNHEMVANVVNRLCLQIATTNMADHEDLIKKLNARRNNFCCKSWAILKRVYFTNPWRGTGTVAAALLLVLTLIQTINSF